MAKYKRYSGILNNDLYFDIFEQRGQKFFKINTTTSFKALQGKSIPIKTKHIWTKYDKLHKLSQEYYSDNSMWWVIAMFNRKPTDAHCAIGDVLYIPENPSHIKDLIEVK